MAKMLKTVLLKVNDTFNQSATVVEVDNTLDAFYENLECEMVETPIRRIGGKRYTIMCDEEGLLKLDPICSAMDNEDDCTPMLYGNLMFFNEDDYGELVGLSDDDVEYIMSHIKQCGDYLMLVDCDY